VLTLRDEPDHGPLVKVAGRGKVLALRT
jgi:hypothetical protein